MDARQICVYFPGVFDLVNHRHFTIFHYYKTRLPNAYLLVGVFGDADALQVAGNVILSSAEREDSVKVCKWVDKVISPCPRFFTVEFLIDSKIEFVCVAGKLLTPEEAVRQDLDYKSQYSELRATLAMAGRFIAKKGRYLALRRKKYPEEDDKSRRIDAQKNKVKMLENALHRPEPEDSAPSYLSVAVTGVLGALSRTSHRIAKDFVRSFQAWTNAFFG